VETNVVIETEEVKAPPVDTGGQTSAAETDEESEEKAPEREFTEQDALTLSESQQAGIKAGNIHASWDVVTVSAKKSPTGKAGVRYYIRLEARNAPGLNQMFNGVINAATPEENIPEGTSKEDRERLTTKGACDYANYGFDLERRASARAQLLSELEGPEKVVKKAVAAFLALDMDRSEIRAMILASPKYKGVEGLAKIVDNALTA
jgi:hypothetical protein